MSTRLMATAAAVIVIVAALAASAWFFWAGDTKFKSEETTVARTNVCNAYTVVRDAVATNVNVRIAKQADPGVTIGVQANARLALLGGGLYLRDRVAQEPAAPADLVKAANAMAKTSEDLSINYLAHRDNAAQDPLREDLNSEVAQLNSLCK